METCAGCKHVHAAPFAFQVQVHCSYYLLVSLVSTRVRSDAGALPWKEERMLDRGTYRQLLQQRHRQLGQRRAC